jgi:hypothetical protein
MSLTSVNCHKHGPQNGSECDFCVCENARNEIALARLQVEAWKEECRKNYQAATAWQEQCLAQQERASDLEQSSPIRVLELYDDIVGSTISYHLTVEGAMLAMAEHTRKLAKALDRDYDGDDNVNFSMKYSVITHKVKP